MDRRRIAFRSALPAALLALTLSALMLAGCALWDPQAFAISGQAADVATTAYALCADNLVELNPTFTLAGEDCAHVVVTSALLKAGMLYGLRLLCKPDECPKAWRVVGSFGWGAALWNTNQIGSE